MRTNHKKQITIAGETIEAEYFSVNYTSHNIPTSLWDKITTPYYIIKRKLSDTYWEIRYGFQRMFRGYDSVDVFDTFSRFTERYYKILTRYRANIHSHPGTMTEEEWENIIDEMLLHLKYMDERKVDEELCKDVPDNWLPCIKTADMIMEKHKDEFFKLFSKYFYNLWD